MTKKILVTGARGLIGGRFLHQLSTNQDWQAIGLSRQQYTGRIIPNISYQAIDWDDKTAINAVCQGVHTIVHLAGMGEPEAEEDPQLAMMQRSLLALRIVMAGKSAGISRFIYVSSSKVYGSNLKDNVTEDTSARPLSHYAITHHTAEDYVLSAHYKGEFDGIVFRLSNGVGAPSSPEVDCWELIANNFCKQAVETRFIKMTGTGNLMRNFISLSDVVGALCFALDASREQIQDGLFNLGSANNMRIVDLAAIIASRCNHLFGFEPKFLHAKPLVDEVCPDLRYNSKKLVNAGYDPQSDLTHEIDNLLMMCKAYH